MSNNLDLRAESVAISECYRAITAIHSDVLSKHRQSNMLPLLSHLSQARWHLDAAQARLRNLECASQGPTEGKELILK
jgi:hypothetical protein